jgi:NAD+ dependent glucose-6-phosphate dehydrogenase
MVELATYHNIVYDPLCIAQLPQREAWLAMKTIVLTGAAGNLGAKLRAAWMGRYALRLIDNEAHGDPEIAPFDLSLWSESWADLFAGAQAVIHLAANSSAEAPWEELLAPNIDALLNVLHASSRAGVRRVIIASSNHVMGGYRNDCRPGMLTTDLSPRPGTRYFAHGAPRDSSPYGATKLVAERVGRWYAERFALSVLVVRIGWVQRGANRAEDLPTDRGDWFRQMWLSNHDFCHLMECCIEADETIRFEVVNGMSNNLGMPWDLEHTRQVVGYQPRDG